MSDVGYIDPNYQPPQAYDQPSLPYRTIWEAPQPAPRTGVGYGFDPGAPGAPSSASPDTSGYQSFYDDTSGRSILDIITNPSHLANILGIDPSSFGIGGPRAPSSAGGPGGIPNMSAMNPPVPPSNAGGQLGIPNLSAMNAPMPQPKPADLTRPGVNVIPQAPGAPPLSLAPPSPSPAGGPGGIPNLSAINPAAAPNRLQDAWSRFMNTVTSPASLAGFGAGAAGVEGTGRFANFARGFGRSLVAQEKTQTENDKQRFDQMSKAYQDYISGQTAEARTRYLDAYADMMNTYHSRTGAYQNSPFYHMLRVDQYIDQQRNAEINQLKTTMPGADQSQLQAEKDKINAKWEASRQQTYQRYGITAQQAESMKTMGIEPPKIMQNGVPVDNPKFNPFRPRTADEFHHTVPVGAWYADPGSPGTFRKRDRGPPDQYPLDNMGTYSATSMTPPGQYPLNSIGAYPATTMALGQ